MTKRIDLKSVMIAPKAEWEANDPVLSIGNLMMEEGTTKSKLSDGVHKWSELHYFTGGEGGDAIAADVDGLLADVTNIKIQLNNLQNDFDAIDTGEIGQKAEDDMVVHRKGVSTETIEGEKIVTGTWLRTSEIAVDNPQEMITAGFLEEQHNKSSTAHNDIRAKLNALTNQVNNISVTGGVDQQGIEADYAIKHGILDCPNGLIEHSQNNKTISIQPGVVLQAAGNPYRTTIASGITYDVQETGRIVIFYAEGGNLLEAGEVYYQEAEPVNGDVGYLAWYKPSLGKWQFKSNATGNVFREAVATPIANVNASETGIISVNYVGYRIMDDDCPAQMSDIDAIEEKIETIQTTLNGVANNTLFTTNATPIADLGSDADLSAIVTAFNGLLGALRTRDIIA